MKKQKRILDFDIKVNKDDRIIEAIGSNDSIDRDNEVLTSDGWDLKNYKKNPVVLWGHNSRELPIARALNVKPTDKGLMFKLKFPEENTYPFADTVFKLFKEKILNAFSVGFMIKERVIPDDLSKPIKITKKELLEISAVPIPANPQALQTNMLHEAMAKGVINEQEYQESLIVAKRYLEEMLSQKDGEENAPVYRTTQHAVQRHP